MNERKNDRKCENTASWMRGYKWKVNNIYRQFKVNHNLPNRISRTNDGKQKSSEKWYKLERKDCVCRRRRMRSSSIIPIQIMMMMMIVLPLPLVIIIGWHAYIFRHIQPIHTTLFSAASRTRCEKLSKMVGFCEMNDSVIWSICKEIVAKDCVLKGRNI